MMLRTHATGGRYVLIRKVPQAFAASRPRCGSIGMQCQLARVRLLGLSAVVLRAIGRCCALWMVTVVIGTRNDIRMSS